LSLRGQTSPLLLQKQVVQEVKENISNLVEMALTDDQYFLIDVIVKGNKGSHKVLVLIDGDDGVNIEVCSKISKHLSRNLDELDLFEGKYTIEVSSPGTDYPLGTMRQYQKNIGRYLEVKSKNTDSFQGKLIMVSEDGIQLISGKNKNESEGKVMEIGFDEIELAKVIVMFQ
jgi:ribosome maturation factor RimP